MQARSKGQKGKIGGIVDLTNLADVVVANRYSEVLFLAKSDSHPLSCVQMLLESELNSALQSVDKRNVAEGDGSAVVIGTVACLLNTKGKCVVNQSFVEIF
jgi:hypothetical protein